MTTAQLTSGTVVELHALHFGEEVDGESEVGRPETGVFIGLPPEGVAILRWLAEGAPLGEVERRFQHTFGSDVDVADFVRDVSGCGFVRSIDGRQLEDQIADVEQRRGWRLLASLPEGRVRWLLSKPAFTFFILVWVGLPVLLLTRRDLVPTAADALVFSGTLPNLVMLIVLGWLLAFLHELAHLVAVRARGSQASLDISHRLHFLVAQTDMTSVRALPRRERYAPYLAGMTWDLLLLTGLSLLRLTSWSGPVSRAAAYLLVMALLFECAVFLRTDLYYVLTNALRLGNLAVDSRRWLANLGLRTLGRPARHDISDVPARELRWVRRYAVIAAAAVSITLGQLLILGLPVLVEFVARAGQGLQAGLGTGTFWASAATLAVIAGEFALLGFAMLRERGRRRSRSGLAEAARAQVEQPTTNATANAAGVTPSAVA